MTIHRIAGAKVPLLDGLNKQKREKFNKTCSTTSKNESIMKMTLEQAEARFGEEAINKLVNMQAEPTGRLIYPAQEPQHAGMDEYMAGSVYVDGGKINAYYFQPTGADTEDWLFGEMNGIEYGDIDNIEYIEDID